VTHARCTLSALLVVFFLACGRTEPTVTALPAPVSHEARAPYDTVKLPGGEFVMGRDDGPRNDEHPAHVAHVDSFEIDRTLVTRTSFAAFVKTTGYQTTADRVGFGMASREGMDDWAWERVPHGSFRAPFIEGTLGAEAFLDKDAPAVMVTHEDAVAYCTHLGMRLPTEVEWEYAMRAGSLGTRYPWGPSPMHDGRLGLNFWQGESHHKNELEDGFLYVSPVRAFPPNAWGLFDPVGNVWQWTSTLYDPLAYTKVKAGLRPEDMRANDTLFPGRGGREQRVLRGGSWWCGACTCEGNGLFYRGHAEPDAVFNNNGFRCAR
jgi:formylglycine-generating enzyme required for sulfatase activity